MSTDNLDQQRDLPSWFPYLDLASVALAGSLWLVWQNAGPWPLIIALVPWLLRWYWSGAPTVRTAFDIPILIFLATAIIAVWSAFDRDLALAKFWLIVTAIFLFYTYANWAVSNDPGTPERQAWTLTLLGTVTAVYFLATHDWETYPVKIVLLAPLNSALYRFMPKLPAEPLHPNVAAGILAVLAPFSAANVHLAWLNRHSVRLVGGMVALGLILFALLMTMARGAWLALGLSILLAAWWGVSRKLTRRRRKQHRWWFVGLTSAILGVFLLIFVIQPSALDRLLTTLPIADTGLKRAELYTNSLSLVQDYPIIGGGLGSFTMLYSTYAILVHVGFIGHSHNIFLDVLIEQGVVALVALAWMWLLMGEAVWRSISLKRVRRRRPKEDKEKIENLKPRQHKTTGRRTLLGAAVCSLMIMLVHGLVDDPLYGSRGLVLLFVPLAFAVPVLRRASLPSRKQQLAVALAAVGLALLLGLLAWRPLLSLATSNLAAIRQSQSELSDYSWPEWPVQDAVRRAVNLNQSKNGFERALSLYPDNAAAARRLGQIEISIGEYDAALDHLSMAYMSRPWDNATRRLLAEALVVNGHIEDGQAFWDSVNNEQGQLNARIYWYGHIGDAERQADVRQVYDSQRQ